MDTRALAEAYIVAHTELETAKAVVAAKESEERKLKQGHERKEAAFKGALGPRPLVPSDSFTEPNRAVIEYAESLGRLRRAEIELTDARDDQAAKTKVLDEALEALIVATGGPSKNRPSMF